MIQWQILGVERFLALYAGGLEKHSYRNSPLEVMAYDQEARFNSDPTPCAVENELRAPGKQASVLPNHQSARLLSYPLIWQNISCDGDPMIAIKTINVEANLPTLDEARRLVIEEIKRAKREGVRVLKIIHGYGSTGKGGKLCVGLRKSFGLRQKEKVIKDFIAGEAFSIFDETTMKLLEAVPELRGDPDLDRTNEGVSLLWLR